MAELKLDSFDDIKVTIAEWLNRADLTDSIPAFIKLAEAEIGRRVRRKTLRATIALGTAAVVSRSDVAELRSMRLVTGSPSQDVPVYIGTPEMVTDVRARTAGVTGRPRIAAVVGSELLLAPAPDKVYNAEITYYEKLVPLSATNQTNSVLTEAPDLYLYGALSAAEPFLKNDERLPVWKGLFNDGIDQLDAAREREETGASLRPSRLPRVF